MAAAKTAITGLNDAGVEARADARFREAANFQKRWLQSRQRNGRIEKVPNTFSRSDFRREK
jgi:antibiotic biosynthesis monooxygenase (ABM) superfamily enzyme